jgi:hypothetical protein
MFSVNVRMSLIYGESGTGTMATMKLITITDTHMSKPTSLINFLYVKSILMENLKFTNITGEYYLMDDESYSLIYIRNGSFLSITDS